MNQKSIALIIPTFNETETVCLLLAAISSQLKAGDLVVVADDSGLKNRAALIEMCNSSISNSELRLEFSFADVKGGRGLAVRRAMQLVVNLVPEIDFIVECDADLSHRVEDVLLVIGSDDSKDVVIGSRYLEQSSIIGWPVSRRLFSKLLNGTIPLLLQVDISDATNGLRRYSRRAVNELLNHQIMNTGFVYLSEQIYILHRGGYSIVEVPITFVNRTIGTSTVSWREVSKSLIGLIRLLLRRKSFSLK